MNHTGILPTEYKVLIAPKAVEEKIGSIIIPEMTKDAEKYATVEGTIIDISHLAFTYATEAEWAGHKPRAGQRVIYAKYAGVRIKSSKDGKEYILANDKDIVAVLAE